MQINRIPKTKLLVTLFGSTAHDKVLSAKEISSYFKKPPLSFSTEEADAIVAFLSDIPKPTAKLIESRISSNTDNWEVFTPEDESSFDEQLGIIVSKNKITLKESCKEKDKENEGLISLQDFQAILKSVAIEFPPRVFKYMLLLFYSHDMKLYQVPYRHFIKAYGEPNEEGDEEEDEFSDEEKAKIVRHYLGIISQILLQNKRNAMHVFECDNNGIVSAEEFIAGLKRIGLGEMEHEHVMLMLEALQFEESDEVCVSIDELEEILKHYGVPPHNSAEGDYESEEESGESGNRYKKVSLLDSGNYEFSEDSGDHPNKGESPITRHKSLGDKEGFANEYSGSDYEEDFQ